MASALHVQIYYYLRVLLQDVQVTLDKAEQSNSLLNLDPAIIHRQIMGILNDRVKPLLEDKSLSDDVDITAIKTRIGDAIYTSRRDINALKDSRKKLQDDLAKNLVGENEAKRSVESAIQTWMKQWVSAIQQGVTTLAYIHTDLIAAVDHVMKLIQAATVHPDPNAPIAARDLPVFITTLVPVGNPAADSPIHRANLAVLEAISNARLETARAIAEFLRRDFAATANLMNQLQGNPNQVVIQNVCVECGRVVRALAYSERPFERFVCADTDSKLHTSSFIQKCARLARERKDSVSSYLDKERDGVHFQTPASFTSWVNSGNFKITKRIYGPRATATEMCHLSRNGYLQFFNEMWTFLPHESKLVVLNCSLRGHHIDAFPDLVGRETLRLEVSSVISFLSLRVARNDAALARVIEARGKAEVPKKTKVREKVVKTASRKVSRLSEREIGPPIVVDEPQPIAVSSSSSSSGPPPYIQEEEAPPQYTEEEEEDDDDDNDEEEDGNGDNDEEEEVKVYTQRSMPEVAARDMAQRVDFRIRENERRQRRMIVDETDGVIETKDLGTWDIRDDDIEDDREEGAEEVSDAEEEDSSMAEEDIYAEEERAKKRTVAEIQAEISGQAEIEQAAVAGSGDSDVRTAWTFTYRDMKNALFLLASTTFSENLSRLDHSGRPPSSAQLSTLAQMVLYCALPPSDQVAKVKAAGNGEVSVLIHDNAAPTQHSRLFERRLETTAAQIGATKQEHKNSVDDLLLKSAMRVISAAVGTKEKDAREDLKPVAVYLAHIARKKTPWAQIRNGDLSEFLDSDDAAGAKREAEIVETMRPYFNYATGLFPDRQLSGKENTYDEILDVVWNTRDKVVDGIADGILPPIEAEDAWDRLAEASPRRLQSLMRVLSKLFGNSGAVYFTKRDWAGLILTTDSLIRRSTSTILQSSEAEEYEFRSKKKYRNDPRFFTKDFGYEMMKKLDAKAKSFNVKDYAKMAATMLGWIGSILPKNLWLTQMVAWQAPYDPWVLKQVDQNRVLLGLRPSNVDEDEQDDVERDAMNALAMMEKEILTEIRSVRRRENDEREAARARFFGNHNISLADLRVYADLWGKVHNPRDRARLTQEQQTDALNELARMERVAFHEDRNIEIATQKLRVAKETLISLVHDAKVYTAEVMYATLEDKNPTNQVIAFLEQLKAHGIGQKINDAADKIIALRKTIDEERKAKDRNFFLGQWIYTKRRILDVDISTEADVDPEEKDPEVLLRAYPEGKDPEAKLNEDLKLSAREVFPQVLEIEGLQVAIKQIITSLDETTRGYVNAKSSRELRHMLKQVEGKADAGFDVAGVTEVLRLRDEMRKLESELARDEQILVNFVIQRDKTQENEDPELRVSQRTKLFQRLLFELGYIWPTLGQSQAGNVPKELIAKINNEKSATQAYSLSRHMVIVDHVVAETIWSSTPTAQIFEVKKPLDYKVSASVHSRDFLQRCAQTDPIKANALFTMHTELGYPWREDDFRFVLQWNYANTDLTFECFNKLIETCRWPGNTKWRRMLLDILADVKEPLDLNRMYPVEDPRRIHSRLRETVLNRIPLTDIEIRFLLRNRWNQLGPDELENFPTLTESQIQFVQELIGRIPEERGAALRIMGIHALYVFSKLVPNAMQNVFIPEVKADEAYQFIKKQGENLDLMRKNQEFCEFRGMPGVMHKISKVRPYGPFFKGASNFSNHSFYIGNVEVSSSLYYQFN